MPLAWRRTSKRHTVDVAGASALSPAVATAATTSVESSAVTPSAVIGYVPSFVMVTRTGAVPPGGRVTLSGVAAIETAGAASADPDIMTIEQATSAIAATIRNAALTSRMVNGTE
jgi:hypothetical protein